MSKLSAILRLKCPACHKGNLYPAKNPYDLSKKASMHKACSVCGQDFVIEPGFYFGAAYVSYGINVAVFIAVMVLNALFWELNIFQMMGVVLPIFLILTPPVTRLARSIWIHIFVEKNRQR